MAPFRSRHGLARARAFIALVLLWCCGSRDASAAFSINPATFSNPASLLDNDIVIPLVRSVGLIADHRAFEPATPLGTSLGLDVGIQLVLVKLPTSFNAALTSVGGSAAAVNVPFVPLPQLNIHKGIGNWVDIGASGIKYQQQEILGFDVKVAVYKPEEGPTIAVRLNYGTSSFSFTDPTTQIGLSLKAQTIKPEVLMSRKLDFADPYIGVGYQYTRGSLGVTVPVPGLPLTLAETMEAESPGGAVAFMGVALRIPDIGLALTLDEEYSSAGADTLGMQVGVAF